MRIIIIFSNYAPGFIIEGKDGIQRRIDPCGKSFKYHPVSFGGFDDKFFRIGITDFSVNGQTFFPDILCDDLRNFLFRESRENIEIPGEIAVWFKVFFFFCDGHPVNEIGSAPFDAVAYNKGVSAGFLRGEPQNRIGMMVFIIGESDLFAVITAKAQYPLKMSRHCISEIGG